MTDAPAAPSQNAPQATPAGAPKRGLLAGIRHWLKLDDKTQVGLRAKRPKVAKTGPAGLVPKDRPVRILFVDVGNASRSIVAHAIALIEGFEADSAGTFPAVRVAPEAIATVKETGLDISGFRPKPLDVSRIERFDIVVSFGDALPARFRNRPNCQVWDTLDPKGMGYVAYVQMRKDIERRVRRLARQYKVRPADLVTLPA